MLFSLTYSNIEYLNVIIIIIKLVKLEIKLIRLERQFVPS